MNESLLKALVRATIVLMRADTDPTLGINTKVGGRIYDISAVPANVAFPRAYIRIRRPPESVRWNRSDGGVDKHIPVEVLFASTTTASPTAAFDIMDLDARARVILEYNVTKEMVPGLVWFRRTGDVENQPQANDLTTYVMGGGRYEAYIQEG
jgi:hypothetical protein